MKLADRLFGDLRKSPNKPFKGAQRDMEAVLSRHGVPFERIGWDYYDNSLEIHGLPAEYRLDQETQKTLGIAGFSTVYANHVDGWETHYGVGNGVSDGWRVSYPHKRTPEPGVIEHNKSILVEEKVEGWPEDWFESGYAVVVKTDPS